VTAHSRRIRFATSADTDEVIRLAALMYEAMGIDPDSAAWRQAAKTALTERLGRDFVVVVAEHPDETGQLVASGAGCVTTRLPGPRNPTATVGYLQWVATEPEWRGQGLARAVVTRLLGWYRDRRVPTVELHATPDAEHLYRSLGFDQGGNPGLRLRLA